VARRTTDAPNSGSFSIRDDNGDVAVFTDADGCPSSWRVRVRSGVGQPPAAVTGIIAFTFTPPGPVQLDMAGSDEQGLDTGSNATRNLKAVAGTASTFIDGTGRFRIKAKWHTDLLDLGHFNTYHKLTVRLLRPDGVEAASMTGFSQHAPARDSNGKELTPKLDLRYEVRAQDAAVPGPWKIEMRNNSEVRVTGFDIDGSTFRAECL
jgi:hypothetical protein